MASVDEAYTYWISGKKTVKTKDKAPNCCGISNRGFAVGIALLEIGISLAGICYAVIGIWTYPEYDANILLQDKMFLEARKNMPQSLEKIPEALLFVDFFTSLTELFLAITLISGLLKKNAGKVQFWLSSMLTYTLIVTGIALGFLIGGIYSSHLNFLAFIHAFFRFSEIGLVYSYYEILRQEKRDKKIFLANNNLDAVANAELQPPENDPDQPDEIFIDNYIPPGIAIIPFV